MATKNQILDLTPLGMKFTVLQSAEDTDGRSLDLHWVLLPGCNMKDPLIHIHPHAKETYEILDGEMEFYIKDKWITAKTGDKIEVPAGVTHGFRNPGTNEVKVFNTHQPAFRMENYFEDIERIMDKATDNRKHPFKMDLKGKLYLGALMSRYRHEIIAVKPPDILVRLLGVVAKVIGIKY